MIGMNVGSRRVIVNPEGKIVGTFLPSKKHMGKIALTTFLPSGTPHTVIKGQEDWLQIQERNPDWTFKESFFTVECKKDGTEVVITLTHNCVPEWHATYRVDHQPNWQESFLDQFRLAQRMLGRETHIGNFFDLTV
jgi:hypothetical protein